MRSLPAMGHPDLIVGYETSDDAGVFRLREDLALVQTVDFITPIVDDPFTFGMIAAANSLSDVWAMGGRPLTVMNILCFPSGKLPIEIAGEILRGGWEKIREAGALLVGGHSLKDREMKYGLSVTGLVHPDRVVTNRGARLGDHIILTKPIGTGIAATAVKGGVADPRTGRALSETASTLNRTAAEVMGGFEVHACTDITGFGLGGHLLEVARASKVAIRLDVASIPLLPGVRELAGQGLVPGGSRANRKFFAQFMEEGGNATDEDLLFDPQTSGGLAVFLEGKQSGRFLEELHRRGVTAARVIGEVTGPSRCGSLRPT